jgi:hypothetical protein
MKKLLLLATAAFLVSGVAFSQDHEKKCAKGKSCCSKSKKSCGSDKKKCADKSEKKED